MSSSGDPIDVLLVEDDAELTTLLRTYLGPHGVALTSETDGVRGLDLALRQRFDVVLLDVMLPGIDGVEVCQRIRAQRDVPIIMISAREEESDRVLGLEVGADDYVPKPFSARELLARIHAQVRRARRQAGPRSRPVCVGGLDLDPGARTAVFEGRPVDLTSYEFDLLLALADAAGRVLSRQQLLERLGGGRDDTLERVIDVHVGRIRHKLHEGDRPSRLIQTVRGVGYRLSSDPGT